jgi:hypothetical protein
MAYAKGWLAGHYRDRNGSQDAQGVVVIEPSELVIKDHESSVLLVGGRTVELVNGSFLAEVIATDDESLDPSGVTYTVTTRLDSYGLEPVVGIVVPTGETVRVR